MNEKEQLLSEINELELQIKPKQERLHKILAEEHEVTKNRVELAKKGRSNFTLDDLVFAAYNRCPCGAGLAYPKNTGPWGSWDCSDILLGRAKTKDHPESKEHTGELPFTFYEIKSEDQPSANGATTRPTS